MQARIVRPLAVVLVVLALAVPATGALKCWGSICQDEGGTIYLSHSLTSSNRIALSTVPGSSGVAGSLTLACTRDPLVRPGLAAGSLYFRPGSVPNTMNLVVIVGSGAEVVIAPNIPGSGC